MPGAGPAIYPHNITQKQNHHRAEYYRFRWRQKINFEARSSDNGPQEPELCTNLESRGTWRQMSFTMVMTSQCSRPLMPALLYWILTWVMSRPHHESSHPYVMTDSMDRFEVIAIITHKQPGYKGLLKLISMISKPQMTDEYLNTQSLPLHATAWEIVLRFNTAE